MTTTRPSGESIQAAAKGRRLRVSLLGPPLQAEPEAAFKLPRGRVGMLLAILAMSAGRPVGVARLAELIWSEEQPEQVRASLHNLVARLRGIMPGVVVTIGDGYMLDVDPEYVDLLRFRRLVHAADGAGDAVEAQELLDQALALWRGEPLSGMRSAALEREVIPGLTDELLSAVQKRAELKLAAGGHDRVIAELRGLVGQYALRESLWSQLIRALSGAGRPAEAIQEYHRAREILAAELGVDPSPELQGLYQKLLKTEGPAAADEPSSAVAEAQSLGSLAGLPLGGLSGIRAGSGYADWVPMMPRQLPAAAPALAGRAMPLRLLSEMAREAEAGPGAVMVSVISGMAGVGKSALALHWAHRAAESFSDGHLYADLRGFSPSDEPMSPAEALRGFLEALGVPAGHIPGSLEARAALYRTVLAGRQVMIVLDNVADAGQVRPLVPASSGCMVVVTSRKTLTSLAAGHGARLVGLDVLTDGEAVELLAARLGTERVGDNPDAASELAALCGRLPLALTITAARAAARPHLPLSVFAAELRDAPRLLDALDGGDPHANLRAAFSWSCRHLSTQAAELFRLLGSYPGPDISLPTAASLAEAEPAATRAVLAELTALNLVTEHAAGRYAIHDLLRAYAAEQAKIPAVDSRAATVPRVLDHHPRNAQSAAVRRNPCGPRLALPSPADSAAGKRSDHSAQALRPGEPDSPGDHQTKVTSGPRRMDLLCGPGRSYPEAWVRTAWTTFTGAW
jgi:DNA-binding SARP family transcriptional activator